MELLKLWNKLFYELPDHRIKNRFLMGSPVGILSLTLFIYIGLVKLKSFMKNRKEISLGKIPLVLNFYLWFGNLLFFYKCCTLGWLTDYSWTCQPVDTSESERALEIVKYGHFLVFFKMTYVLEIVFFILRKREDLLTFYLYFHHLTFPLLIWIAANYYPGGHVTFVAFANSLSHLILLGAITFRIIFLKASNPIIRSIITHSHVIYIFIII